MAFFGEARRHAWCVRSVGRRAMSHVDLVIANRPLERGLQLEALPLPLLVVRGDALGGLRGDVSLR